MTVTVAGRRERIVLAGELALLVALTVADARGLVPLSRTPFLVLMAWASLRLRRMPWASLGLSRPPSWQRAIALGVAIGIAIELFAVGVTTPWIGSITGAPPDVSDLRPVVGNALLLLLFLVINWILAAFGEELAFRGYLMTRGGDALGRTPFAWIVSLVGVSIFFGMGHATQGLSGILQESLSGFWLGVVFLATGRNLVIPIVAHGVSNSLALVLIYFGRYPGLG